MFQEFIDYNKEQVFFEEIERDDNQSHTILDGFVCGEFSKIATYIVQPHGKGPFPTILFIHWLETNADNSNRKQFLQLAIELAKKGYLSILPDCFWSLEKEKFAKNPSQYTKKWWKTDIEHDKMVIRKQVKELLSIQDYIATKEDVDKERIGLVAHDFGAMFATLISTINPVYKSYAFMALTPRFSDWFRFGSKLSDDELRPYIDALSFLDPITLSSSLEGMDGLLLFADNDFYVPMENAKKFYNSYAGSKEMRIYQADHGLNANAFEDLRKWILNSI